MSGKKNAGWLLAILSALILITVMLLTVIEECVFDLDFYRAEYQKLNSVTVIGMTEQDLMRTTEQLLFYIQGNTNDLKIKEIVNGEERQVFNQREITHLADVQRLYAVSHWTRNAGLFLLALFLLILKLAAGRSYYRYWAGGYIAGAVIFSCALGAVLTAIARDFQTFWDQFHYLIFTNDLWLLDPKTDILIQMVPEQFFFDLVSRILFYSGFAVLIPALIAGKMIFRCPARIEKNII